MGRTAGVLVVQHIAAGLVEGNRAGELKLFPEKGESHDALLSMPAAPMAGKIGELRLTIAGQGPPRVLGVGFPGIMRDGVIEESPNLQQIKGFRLQAALEQIFLDRGAQVRVRAYNDADATAAGIAATRGVLHKVNRVWTLGNGVGFGRYPWADGPWTDGHLVLTLNPNHPFY